MRFTTIAVASLAGLAACGGSVAAPTSDASVKLVHPASASGVAVDQPLTFTFGGAMTSMAAMPIVLHEGSSGGPVVPMTVSWTADGKQVTITPASPLKHATTYWVEFDCSSGMHAGMMNGGTMGGGMMGASEMSFSFTTS